MLPRSPDVNMILTVSLLASVVSYSSQVQQPIRATAVLGGHPHTRWAAPVDREQGRASSLHPGGAPHLPVTFPGKTIGTYRKNGAERG